MRRTSMVQVQLGHASKTNLRPPLALMVSERCFYYSVRYLGQRDAENFKVA